MGKHQGSTRAPRIPLRWSIRVFNVPTGTWQMVAKFDFQSDAEAFGRFSVDKRVAFRGSRLALFYKNIRKDEFKPTPPADGGTSTTPDGACTRLPIPVEVDQHPRPV